MPGSWESEEAGISLVATVNPGPVETSSAMELVTPSEERAVSANVDGPTGCMPREGVVPNQQTVQVADVEAQGVFDPSSFRLLLKQSGYKTW